MKPSKIKKINKAPPHIETEKPDEIDLFTTLYGENPTLDQMTEYNKMPKHPKNKQDNEMHSPRRFPHNNPVAPINININNPKVIVPNPKPLKTNSKSNLVKNVKSKLAPESSPRRHLQRSFDHSQLPPTPSTNPRISNDHLTMFDDDTYDDQKFLQNIISLINSNEQVTAKSLFYHQNGQCEWRKCIVVGYKEPRFIIKFDPESSKTKEVPRVALKFDLDDQKRFENRRVEAYSNRIEVDQQLRLETYLYTRATKTKGVIIDPEMLKRIIKRIGPKSNNTNLLNNLVQEIHENFLYADALCQFVLEWQDPKAAEKFTKNGLEKYQFEIKPWKNLPKKIDIEYSQKVILPNQVFLQQIVDLCNSFKNNNFLIIMFKQMHPPIQLSYFFEQLKFEVNTEAFDARVNLRIKIAELLKKIVCDLRKNISLKMQKMINLRYKEVLGSIINRVFTESFDLIKKYKIKFDISVDDDLKTINPSYETIQKFGIESFESILKTFENNETPEIEVFGNDPKNLSILFDYLNDNLEKVKTKYLNLLDSDIKSFKKIVEKIFDATKDIPKNPESISKEIFKDDYFKDDLTKEDIDFDLIREKLNHSKSCYKQFRLTFSDKIDTELCSFDIKKFYQSTIDNYEQFYSSIFNQLELIADYQTSKIHHNVEFLYNKSGQESNSIEEWYEKHCILLDIKRNIHKIEDNLNFVLSIINFMTDFQYQPQRDYVYICNVKNQLLKVYLNIKKYNELDRIEKVNFIVIHRKNIEKFKKELEEFQVELMNFHYIESNESNYPTLIQCKNKYDKLIEKMNLYHKRDSILEVSKTEYEIVESLQTEIDDILNVWTIGHKLETDVESWLSIPFRELNIKMITKTLVEWRKTLENLRNKLEEEKKSSLNNDDDDDLIIPTIIRYQERIKELIQHLPIVTCLCNKHFRGRHWYKINTTTMMNIDVNEGLTWNWLIESGIEDHMLAIQAICRAADSEFKIESALLEMVEELQAMRLKVNEEDGVLRLEDPSYAMVMLGKHQQKLQEIFIPPYVHPFLERIREYNVLASNLRQILKQTIEAQQKIDELKPAMDSNDIRTQHEEMAVKFDNQVQKFNEFTGSFKLSLSFHQIVGNDRYMDISSDLLSNFNDIRENLGTILEEKRKLCPRFRLLSDSQLVFLISNCNKPSVTKKVFSLMYPNVKKILLENENYCVGFIAKSGEKITFENKIKVTPEAIEKWHLEFDNEIKEIMKKMTQVVIAQITTNLEKILPKFPIQIICLVYETIFTSNVNKLFHSHESNFLENKQQNFIDLISYYLTSITKDISLISDLYKKTKIKSISSLILTLLNQRDLLAKTIEYKVDSSMNPLWYSSTKFVINNHENPNDFSISVQIGPISYEYGFEYTGIQRLIIKNPEFNHLFSNFLLSISNSVIPLLCADVEIRKTDTVIDFASVLGYSPFVYPCYSSTTIDKLKSAINNARDCKEFLILEGINKLMPNTLNELSVWTFCEKNKSPIIATYSILLKDNSREVPEQLKLYYRPVYLKSIDLEKKYKLILQSLLIGDSDEKCQYASSRFAYLTQTVSKAFRPPLSTILMENSIIQFFRNHPSISIEELVQSFILHVKSYLVEYDLNEMIEYICCLFNHLQIDFDPAIDYNMSEDLIKMKNKEIEIENIKDFDQNILYSFNSHYGIIVLGRAMTGKTTLIENVANKMKKKLLYINPYSISMEDLYGDKSSGLLSSLLTENGTDQWIVFDGSCRSDWMEIASYVLINNNKRITFGDGSMLVLASSFRIIFETDDISMASPLTLGVCTTIYISEDKISLDDRLNKFIEILSNETRIIEKLSNTIVGSTTSASKLIDIVRSFFNHFVPKISEFVEDLNCCLSVSKVSNFVLNFFESFHCNLLNYYVSENKHTADDLLSDVPNLLLFALFWSFAGSYENENRIKISDFLIENVKEYVQSINPDLSILKIEEEKFYIFDFYYDEEIHSWKNWNEKENVLPDLMEVSPYSIFIPTNSLISVYSILKSLIHQQMNVLLFGDDANHITPYVNICLNSDYFLSEMSPILYNSFGKLNVRDILQSFLPDLNVTNGLSVRYPLLTLLGIDTTPGNRNSELLRSIMEHKFFRNIKTFVDESVPSLRHLLTTDKKELNPRLCHFCFLLNIEKENNQVLKDAFSSSIEKIWKIDKNLSSFVSDLFINTLEKVRFELPHFNFNSIQLIFQRITKSLNKDEQNKTKNIINSLCNEFLFTFYESTKNDKILTIINDSNHQLIDHYNESNNDDSIIFAPEEKINAESQDESLEIDIKTMTKLLKTIRNNIFIKSDSKEIPLKIIESCCNRENFFFHRKKLEENLLKSFHDCFVHAGMKKEHSILFIDDSSLKDQELELLNLILKNENIFGLFPKGEKMKLMSELHSKDANSFDEGTIESTKNFNFLISEFLFDSEKYCHIVIATHLQNENSFKNVSVYYPLTESIKEKRFLHLRDVLQTNLPHLFNNYPYLLSETNLKFILKKVDEKENQIKEKVELINERFSNLKESKEINDSFLDEYLIKMKNTEIDINHLNDELKISMENLQQLQENSQQQTTSFEAEAEELKIEESKVQVLRKECEAQLAETKAILENASQEVKHLSVRDTAVIKGMNHPPKGVVLVVIAMCIVMDIDIDYNQKNDDLLSTWAKGKSVMNDPSFINKLINCALDSLNPLIIQKLQPIINDQNFEPTIIEKSSSAAKSICIFIRSLPKYYEALKIYREKNSLMTEMEEKLSLLFEKQNEAMQKLTLSKNRCIENQQKIEKITQTKKSYEDQLTNQREKIGFYQKFQETIELYTNEQFELLSEKIKKYKEIDEFLFIKQVFKDLCGPFTDSQRNEILTCLKNNLNQPNQTRESLLFCNNDVVKKWHKLQYPISQFWKENSSLLAPEGGRWVVVEGLRCCSSSYLKKLLNSVDLPILSVFSETFEKDFIQMIQKSNRIIITDYDFKCPSIILSLTNKSIENNENTLFYQGDEITFQKDLIVYFDVDSLPSVSYIDFNATLVNLRVGFAICAEQISLSIFSIKSNFSEIQRNENSIYSSKKEISEIEKEIESLLIENRIEIFDSKEIQKTFVDQSKERSRLIKELNELKEIHLTLFDTFSDTLKTASEICVSFEKFPIQTSIWRIYENYFQTIPSVTIETIESHLRSVILATLPSKLRMDTILNAYSIAPENFDKDIEKVASLLGNYELFKMQNHSNIIKETAPNRPVFVVSPSSQFEICSFINFLKNNKSCIFNYSDNLCSVVKSSISNGTIVAILLNSIDDLKNSISAVSIVLSQSVFNQSFRLFLIVTFPLHLENDLISGKLFLPSIVTFCDTIYFTQPFNAYSIFTQLNPSNQIVSKLAAFHSVSSIVRRFKLCGKVHEFSSFLLSQKCLTQSDEIKSENVGGIEIFISLFIYGDGRLNYFLNQSEEERLNLYTNYLSNLWNTQISMNSSFDSPESFGLTENDFDFFKEKSYPYRKRRSIKNKVNDSNSNELNKNSNNNEEEENKNENTEICNENERNEEMNDIDENYIKSDNSNNEINKVNKEEERNENENTEICNENEEMKDIDEGQIKNDNSNNEINKVNNKEEEDKNENSLICNENDERKDEMNDIDENQIKNDNSNNEINKVINKEEEDKNEKEISNNDVKITEKDHQNSEFNEFLQNNVEIENSDEKGSQNDQVIENSNESQLKNENENENKEEEENENEKSEKESNNQIENSEEVFISQIHHFNDDENDSIQNGFQSLMTIDFSSLSDIPRELSREMDFAQENLRSISEGKSEFTPLFQKQLLQLISVPDIYDMSLFVSPGDFFEIVKIDFLENNRIFSKSVLMIEDSSKYYEELNPCGVLCKGIVAINAKFSDGKFSKYDGFTLLDEFWLRPISCESKDFKNEENLNIVQLYKNGEIVDSLYIRFSGDSNELEKVVLLNNL